jgi:hypothetical protein
MYNAPYSLGSNNPTASRLPDSELATMVDNILISDDMNDNGMVEYGEFLLALRKHQER